MWNSHVDDDVDVLEVEVGCWKSEEGDLSGYEIELEGSMELGSRSSWQRAWSSSSSSSKLSKDR